MSDSIHMPFLARNIHVTESTDPTLVGISGQVIDCLLYTSPSPRDGLLSRMPSSA